MNRLPDRTSPPPEPVSHPVSLPIPPPDTRKTHTNLLDLLDVDPVLDFFLAPAADHSLDTPSSPELAPLLFSPGQVAQRRCLPWLRSPPLSGSVSTLPGQALPCVPLAHTTVE